MNNTWIWIEKLFPALLFVSIFLVMLLEIFSRKLAGKPFPWSTEFCCYALVWVTFVGAAYIRRQHAHIKVDALYLYFRNKGWTKVTFALDCLVGVLAVLFWFVLAYYGLKLSIRVSRIVSSALEASMFWLYISTCVGGVLAGVMEILGLARLLIYRTGDGPAAGEIAGEEETV